MLEIVPLAQPVTRSQYFAFEVSHPLPSGRRPHLYTRPFRVGAGADGHDVALVVLLTGLMRASGEAALGIRGYLDELDCGPEFRYRLDCEEGDGDAAELEDWLVGLFNGLVEELDAAWEPSLGDVDRIFCGWGIELEGTSY